MERFHERQKNVAGLAGTFAVMYIISIIWYLFIIGGYNEVQFAAVARAELSMTMIIVGYLVLTFLMSYIYPIGFKGGEPLQEGLRFGVLL